MEFLPDIMFSLICFQFVSCDVFESASVHENSVNIRVNSQLFTKVYLACHRHLIHIYFVHHSDLIFYEQSLV